MTHIRPVPTLMLLAIPLATSHASDYLYDGEAFFCSTTCNSFASLGGETGGSDNAVNSDVAGVIDLPIQPDGTFEFGVIPQGPIGSNCGFEPAIDDVLFSFSFTNAGAPLCPDPENPDLECTTNNVNPLVVDNNSAVVFGEGSVDADGNLTSGRLHFTFTVAPPLCNNSVGIEFNLSDASFTGDLFNGAIRFLEGTGQFAGPDSDSDGVADANDNCTLTANPDQRDSNGDGYGNACDTDLNGDCVTNVVDLGLLRSLFFSMNEDADFNGDGMVQIVDLGIMREAFFQPPGPSGLDGACESGE